MLGKKEATVTTVPVKSPDSPQKSTNGITFERPEKKGAEGVTEKLVDLSLQDKPNSEREQPTNRGARAVIDRVHTGNLPPTRRLPRRPPPNMNHRTTHSNEEKSDMKPAEKTALDVFASPGKPENRRPVRARRNSETSMTDAKDEERRRRERERRRRDREHRDKDKDGKSRSHHRSRKPQGMDIIDQLDVTGLYGPGMIHHDGPFDACNPHRNKKNYRGAPMSAFPEGSLNNVLGGSGPVNKTLDYNAIHGHTNQGFTDYNDTTQQDTANYNSYKHLRNGSGSKGQLEPLEENFKQNIEQVHGEESAGLGTSTFFEGTPASRRDLERDAARQSEEQQLLQTGVGLSRKRSIAQKIRGISRPRQYANGQSVTSPTGRWTPASPDYVDVQSAGGRSRLNTERNPFDEMGRAKPADGAATTVAPAPGKTPGWGTEPPRPRTASSPHRNRERAPSSPKREFVRVKSNDDEYGMPSRAETAPTGIIGRVKSLRTKRPARFGGGGVGGSNGSVPVAVSDRPPQL